MSWCWPTACLLHLLPHLSSADNYRFCWPCTCDSVGHLRVPVGYPQMLPSCVQSKMTPGSFFFFSCCPWQSLQAVPRIVTVGRSQRGIGKTLGTDHPFLIPNPTHPPSLNPTHPSSLVREHGSPGSNLKASLGHWVTCVCPSPVPGPFPE